MSEFLIKETPEKVLSLVGAALFSFAFLFAVSATDASLAGTYASIPDPFSPEKVVAVVDNVAQSYSNFLSANFIQPLAVDYKVYGENLVWLAQQSGVVKFLGLERSEVSLAYKQPVAVLQGKVAGAMIFAPRSNSGFSVDDIYGLLIR